jgi:hypothetical protein
LTSNGGLGPPPAANGASEDVGEVDGRDQLPKLILGVKFTDRLEAIAKPTDLQSATVR